MELDSFAADKSDVAGFFVGSNARQIGSLSQSIGKPNIDLPRHLEGEHFRPRPNSHGVAKAGRKLWLQCDFSCIAVVVRSRFAAFPTP